MALTRFLHTADWHLGMTRRFLPPEAQARYSEARIDSVRDMARIAADQQVDFVLACGDLFDSNHVDRQVLARAAAALGEFTVPVLIVPGNHDPLDAASVYRTRAFGDRLPSGVTIISNSDPIRVGDIEVVGAPWYAKRPGCDPSAAVVRDLAPGTVRVLAAHGVVDVLSPDPNDPSVIALDGLRRALDAGALAYVALGDRHSTTQVADDPRIWYPGTPVATDHGEDDPGNVLVVTLDESQVTVEPHRVGEWTFVRLQVRLDGADDITAFAEQLQTIPNPSRTVVRLAMVGALGVAEDARLHQILDDQGDVFASLTVSEGRSDLRVVVADDDLSSLGLSGYAHDAAVEIAALAASDGPQQQAARDALRVLYRLAGAAA